MNVDSCPTVFISSLIAETNTFSPIPTGSKAWTLVDFYERDASLLAPTGAGYELLQFRTAAEAKGLRVVEGLRASAEPAGPTTRAVYDDLKARMLGQLAAAGPVSMVLLALHGAMMAVGVDDCEGDLIQGVRSIVGPEAVVGVQLDPHCHLSDLMLEGADAIVLMKEYPHVDFAERAEELFSICYGKLQNEFDPVSAVYDCKMVGLYPTGSGAMRSLVDECKTAEQSPGILSVSIVHGFPWGDNVDAGTKVLVIADGDLELAKSVAERLGLEVYRSRFKLLNRLPNIDEALAAVRSLDTPIVLADTADNTGGGAPGDSTSLIAALLASDLSGIACGAIYDPQAVAICMEAGEEATVNLRIGGKLGAESGNPIDVVACIMALREGHRQTAFGQIVSLGDSAWIRVGSTDIILSSVRSQVYGMDAFTGIGLQLGDKNVVMVKSTEHFRADFQHLSSSIILVGTPGALQMDFAGLRYNKRRDQDFFPKIADPLQLAS